VGPRSVSTDKIENLAKCGFMEILLGRVEREEFYFRTGKNAYLVFKDDHVGAPHLENREMWGTLD
jgi:hypothetical protein